jgi:hypothetical protein
MSIFRTVRKVRDCDTCFAVGKIVSDGVEIICPDCQGAGKVEILSRVSQASAARAQANAKTLPPHERAIVRQRLEDHEPAPLQEEGTGDQPFPKVKKQGKVGKDFIEEP